MEEGTNTPDTAIAGPSLALDSEQLARDYDRISAQRQFLAGQQLVERLDIKPGERVLDVGCGTGLLAEYIAGLTGASGYVLGIDPLPLRVGLASARVRPGSNSVSAMLTTSPRCRPGASTPFASMQCFIGCQKRQVRSANFQDC